MSDLLDFASAAFWAYLLLAWLVAAIALGLVIGRAIRDADEAELGETVPDRVSQEWWA